MREGEKRLTRSSLERSMTTSLRTARGTHRAHEVTESANRRVDVEAIEEELDMATSGC